MKKSVGLMISKIFLMFQNKFKFKCGIFISLLWLIGSTQSCTNLKRESRIELVKNGYTNIVIGIEESVEENLQLIERIKESFMEASQLLFNITKYFS